MDDVLALTSHCGIIGVASDGFRIYGPVGYSTATDSSSALKLMVSSYECKSESGTAFSGEEVVQPELWSYTEGAGDLDVCSGRYGVTPAFPEGMYYYAITADATGFPTYLTLLLHAICW